MIEWWAGATDTELARRWGLSIATVAQQRLKRGLRDGDRDPRREPPRS